MKRGIALASGVVLTGLLLLFVASRYVKWSTGITVEVRDARTSLPVEGVVVAATWAVHGLEGAVVDTIHAAESTTDAAGMVTLHAWGPRISRRAGEMRQPHLRFLKEGYVPAIIRSARRMTLEGDVRPMVQLVPASDVDKDAYRGAVEEIVASLRDAYRSGRCVSQLIPTVVGMIESMSEAQQPQDVSGMAMPFPGLGAGAGCGSGHRRDSRTAPPIDVQSN